MSIASEMVNPQGRLGPKAFQKNGLILLAIGFLVALTPLVSLTLSFIASLIGLVLIYPWIVIWIKRLHDSGKSGWLLLLVILLYLIVTWAASAVITPMFGPDLTAVAATNDFSAIWATMGAASRDLALPNALCTLVIGVVFIFGANAALKSDPGANQYGAPAE